MINKSLSAGNNFMHKLNLKQPGYTYSSSEPFTKHWERIKKIQRNRPVKLYL